MDSGFIIDDMRDGDLAQVLEIEKASFPSPWSRELFLNELEKDCSFNLVARSTGAGEKRVLGYIVFWLVVDEMHLLDLAVRADSRRHGVARSLLTRAMEVASERECIHFFLEVRKNNLAATGLYRSLDFKEVGLRKKYYSDGEDAVVMARKV